MWISRGIWRSRLRWSRGDLFRTRQARSLSRHSRKPDESEAIPALPEFGIRLAPPIGIRQLLFRTEASRAPLHRYASLGFATRGTVIAAMRRPEGRPISIVARQATEPDLPFAPLCKPVLKRLRLSS